MPGINVTLRQRCTALNIKVIKRFHGGNEQQARGARFNWKRRSPSRVQVGWTDLGTQKSLVGEITGENRTLNARKPMQSPWAVHCLVLRHCLCVTGRWGDPHTRHTTASGSAVTRSSTTVSERRLLNKTMGGGNVSAGEAKACAVHSRDRANANTRKHGDSDLFCGDGR